jgi:endonuclease/exonuclease/phosphatase family metal-dependent hydrolase
MKIRIFLLALIISCFVSCKTQKKDLSQNTISIGTFNIEWLGDGVDDTNPRKDADYKRIAETIQDLDVDILGVEEIENQDALNKVLTYLPEYKSLIGNTGSKQNTAVFFKDGLDVKKIEDYKSLDVQVGKTRSGLMISAKKGNFDFIMMVVHLKSTSRFDSTEQMKIESHLIRQKQALVLRNWADSINKFSNEKDVFIVGDFNDNPTRKKQNNLFPLASGGDYIFLTQDFVSCKNPKWDIIDHIVVNKSALKRFYQGSVYVYDIFSKFSDYEVEKISDHCPVTAKFEIDSADND